VKPDEKPQTILPNYQNLQLQSPAWYFGKARDKPIEVISLLAGVEDGNSHKRNTLFVYLHLKLDDIVAFHSVEHSKYDTNKHDDHS